jgi:D-alanyl-D-alanine endopeptidase (penicillin-binding protein 7)
VNNVAAPFIVILMLVWTAMPYAAQTEKSAKSGVSTKNASKRVSVSYKKNGGKTVRKAVAKAAPAAAAAPAVSAVEINGTLATHGPDLKSSTALVFDAVDGTVLYGKNTGQVSAIASITKLMTAMVVLDADLPLDESIRIDKGDIDKLKHTGSRLRIGSVFARRDLLHMALMSSENRAASALGRSYPGGTDAFVARMNEKAHELGMRSSRFAEPTGLSSQNVSTADDLALLVRASLDYPLIREFTTTPSAQIHTADNGHVYGFSNSNGLVRTSTWQIDVSKTGYISEAGQCLVMQARIRERPIIIVLLDSWGKYTRIGDANRIKKWLESTALAEGPAS